MHKTLRSAHRCTIGIGTDKKVQNEAVSDGATDTAADTKGWFADYQLRVTVAFIVAPVVVPVSVVAYVTYYGLTPIWVLMVGFLSIWVAYGGTLIVGIPLYLFLRARKWTYLWVAATLGFLVGIMAWTASFAILSFDATLSNLREALASGKGLSDLVWPGGSLGFLVGVILWLIARPDLDHAPPK